jgi:hypothetical protein
MERAGKAELERAIPGAFAWWRDAGVDCCFADEPVDWLAGLSEPGGASAPPATAAAPPVPDRRAAVAAPPAAPLLDPALFPTELEALRNFWLTEPALDSGRLSGRVPPRGAQGARLMAIVADPEAEDRELLLSGPRGRLLEAMTAAMGIAPGDVYAASILPRHMPLPDWPALSAQGFGALAAHHVALVRPERIIAFGGNTLPLPGNSLPNMPADLREFNHEGLSIPLWNARDFAELLARHGARARFWRQWLDWTGNEPK